MEQLVATVLRNAWAVFFGMMAAGAGFALLRISLPAVLLFLLSGLLLMFLSGRQASAAASQDAGTDADTA